MYSIHWLGEYSTDTRMSIQLRFLSCAEKKSGGNSDVNDNTYRRKHQENLPKRQSRRQYIHRNRRTPANLKPKKETTRPLYRHYGRLRRPALIRPCRADLRARPKTAVYKLDDVCQGDRPSAAGLTSPAFSTFDRFYRASRSSSMAISRDNDICVYDGINHTIAPACWRSCCRFLCPVGESWGRGFSY